MAVYQADDARLIGLTTLSHEDCDTIPFFWNFANRFTIFDKNAPGIPTDKPKGTIELVYVTDSYSIGKIVKTFNPIEPMSTRDVVMPVPPAMPAVAVFNTWPNVHPPLTSR